MQYDIKPFLKWAGGKRQLISQIEEHFPKNYNKYYEPFLGAGALFFYLQPKEAILNDANKELIETYQNIQNNLEALISELQLHKDSNSKEYYYKIRKWDRETNYSMIDGIKKSARFIYMNRVGFNGLYRVNSKGQFNVPYGKYKKPTILDEELLKNISEYLNTNQITFLSTDFETAVKDVSKGDLVYFDPPYDPINETSSFTKYQKDGFSQQDQIRLKLTADLLVHKGAKVILSNSNTEFIKKLYSNELENAKGDIKYFFYELIDARRNINSKASKRGPVKEVIIVSDNEYWEV